METYEDSNHHSLSDSFSLYERYMRSFSVNEDNRQENKQQELDSADSSSNNSIYENINRKHVDLGIVENGEQESCTPIEDNGSQYNRHHEKSSLNSFKANTELCLPTLADCTYSLDNSVATEENSLNDKPGNVDMPVTSEDSKSDYSINYPKPVVITSASAMENSNNAVDSVPLFHNVRPLQTVFKLPVTELSFNGTIKHVQKLKPMIDPITALSSVVTEVDLNDSEKHYGFISNENIDRNYLHEVYSETSEDKSINGAEDSEERFSDTTNDKNYNVVYNSNDSQDKFHEVMHDKSLNGSENRSHLKFSLTTDDEASNVMHDNRERLNKVIDEKSITGEEDRSSSQDRFSGATGAKSRTETDKRSGTHESFSKGADNKSIHETENSSFSQVRDNEATHSKYINKLEGDNIQLREVTNDLSMNDVHNNFHSLPAITESTGDSQYEELHSKNNVPQVEDVNDNTKYSLEQSYSSMEASFDSGVRSPDIFSEDEEDVDGPMPVEYFWDFIKDIETEEKIKVKKLEDALRGLPPPPSITTITTTVTEMLKKYYSFLPLFSDNPNAALDELNPCTPNKGVSFANITSGDPPTSVLQGIENVPKHDEDISKLNKQIDPKEAKWPDVLKCKLNDVHYNITSFSEKLEQLSMKCSERFVGAETASTVTIFSDLSSPSSAKKRKEWRMRLAQSKSPCRRLTHLARRRMIPCNAATIHEKVQSSMSKMVLIDKNYFPHRKMLFSSDRKSPRIKYTAGQKTPGKKTPRKKTPAKTPKSQKRGSSKKKAVRKLIMEPDNLNGIQPTRETSRRALFVSTGNNKTSIEVPSTSVPQAVRLKRALFASPINTSETENPDPTPNDNCLKRKFDASNTDTFNESSSKMSRSLSYAGTSNNSSQSVPSISRRASEVLGQKNNSDLNELRKRKLLWAVTEALRVHGWRMGSPGFREKASLLARLTRRILSLPPHAITLSESRLSTSEFMLKLARQYVFAIIQGKTVDECFKEEQMKLGNIVKGKITGYISPATYQHMKTRQSMSSASTSSQQIKENACDSASLKNQPKSALKNVLQDTLNIDSNSNSGSEIRTMDKSGLFQSNSMPSFNEAAKMRACRQISFDILDIIKR